MNAALATALEALRRIAASPVSDNGMHDGTGGRVGDVARQAIATATAEQRIDDDMVKDELTELRTELGRAKKVVAVQKVEVAMLRIAADGLLKALKVLVDCSHGPSKGCYCYRKARNAIKLVEESR